MKTKISRTPTDLLDDLSIFCYNLRIQNVKLQDIANVIRKDHSTVMYHLRRYDSLSKFNKEFKNRIKNFNEEQFLRKMNFSKILKRGSVKQVEFYINTEKISVNELTDPILENFISGFLNATKEQQQEVMRFQELIFRKS